MNVMTKLSPSELAVRHLENARAFLLKLIDTLEPEQYLARAAGVGNHAAWIIGHLAVADDYCVSEFTGRPAGLPDGYRELFNGGTEPAETCAGYPPREQMLKHLAESRERTVAWARSLQGDDLWQPAPESIVPIAPNALSALHALAEHDFLHAGQIAAIRSSLGMKPVFSF